MGRELFKSGAFYLFNRIVMIMLSCAFNFKKYIYILIILISSPLLSEFWDLSLLCITNSFPFYFELLP